MTDSTAADATSDNFAMTQKKAQQNQQQYVKVQNGSDMDPMNARTGITHSLGGATNTLGNKALVGQGASLNMSNYGYYSNCRDSTLNEQL